MAAEVDEGSINLLLVGMAGDGKSSTGNTILGQEKFKAEKSPLSTTEKCQGGFSRVQGHEIVVVDSPGVEDIDIETDVSLKRLTDEIRIISGSQPDGFDAILIVIQYGRKLTCNDLALFQKLETLFGTEYIKQSGIIVVTHADFYDPRKTGKMPPLETFLQQQSDVLQEIREKCNNRLITFDNKSKDESLKESQVKRLLDMVAEMRKQPDRYTPEIFHPAIRERIEYFLKRDQSVSLKNIDTWLPVFVRDLENIPSESFSSEQLQRIQAKLTAYRKEYTKKNAGKGKLTQLISRISKVEDDITARLDDPQNVPGADRRETGEPRDSKTYQMGEDFINVLLVGKAGNGKSATGNSIIGEKRFESKASTTSTTKKCQREVARVQGYNVVVVDSPGLADTDIDTDGGLQQLEDEITNIFAIHPDSFDALLITISFGSRLTEEEKRVVQELELLFEKDFMKHCAILVVTHADDYRPEENDNVPIEKCVESQSGPIVEFLNKCSNRMVCFDNKTKDESVRQLQVKRLLDMAVRAKQNPPQVSPEIFVKAQKTRDEALERAKQPIIDIKTETSLLLIIQDLESIPPDSTNVELLKIIRSRILQQHRLLIDQNKATGKLRNAISILFRLEDAVRMRIEAIEENRNMKQAVDLTSKAVNELKELVRAYADMTFRLMKTELPPVLTRVITKLLRTFSSRYKPLRKH